MSTKESTLTPEQLHFIQELEIQLNSISAIQGVSLKDFALYIEKNRDKLEVMRLPVKDDNVNLLELYPEDFDESHLSKFIDVFDLYQTKIYDHAKPLLEGHLLPKIAYGLKDPANIREYHGIWKGDTK